jgi:DNA-binding MarR family transcriptional regulator
MNIQDFLKDKDGVGRLKHMIMTPEGQRLLQRLKNVDKAKLFRLWDEFGREQNLSEHDLGNIADNQDLIRKVHEFLDRHMQ